MAIDIVFDNRKMATKMLIIVVAIAILITYGHLVGNHKELSIKECLEAPEKYDGTLLVIKKRQKLATSTVMDLRLFSPTMMLLYL